MSESTTPIPDQTPPPDKNGEEGIPVWRRALRWLRRIGLGLLLLLLLLQLPAVQQWLAQRVITVLENKLETPVSLDRVRLVFFDELTIENLYVEDVYGDTLLASGKIVADFNLNPVVLLRDGLEIEALSINGARFNIQRAVGDPETNLKVALNKLIQPKEQPDEPKDPVSLNLRELHLSDVQFYQNDSINGAALRIYLDDGQLWLNQLNLPDQLVDVNTLRLGGPEVHVLNYIGTPLTADQETLDSLIKAQVDSMGWQFQVGEFRMEEGLFSLHSYRKSPVKLTPADQMDFQHLEVFDINMEIDSFQFHRDTFTAQVNWIAAKEQSGFVVERLSAKDALVSPSSVVLNGLSLITPTSELGDTLRFRYREYDDWNDFPNQVRMDARMHGAAVTLDDIIAFAPGLSRNQFFANNRNTQLFLDGRARGTVNNLRGSNLNIRLEDGTQLEGSFSTQNLGVKNDEFLILNLERLNTRMRTLRELIPNFSPPPNFNRLGRLNFSGNFAGFFYDFVADGSLSTDLGRATIDMQMVLGNGPERARYSGTLNLIDFDLGGWSNNPDFGQVNFSSQVDNGVGLTGSSASAELAASIESFSFRGYDYQNANVTGQLNSNFFNGDFAIADENIDFSFIGKLDFRDSIPQFDFQADVQRLDMKALNLSPQDLVLGGGIDLNLRNNRFSDMEGRLRATDLEITKDQTDRYFIDSILAFTFFDQSGEKVFRLESDIAEGEVRGSFDINELPAALQVFALENYPGFANRMNLRPPKRLPSPNQFRYYLKISDSKGLNWLVSPKLGRLENAYFDGAFNSDSDSLLLNVELPVLRFDKFRFTDVFVKLDAEQNEGGLDIVIDSTYFNDKPRLSRVTYLSILKGDTVKFGFNYRTDSPSLLDAVNLNGTFYLPDSTHYAIRFKQSNLSLLEMPWRINEDNTIRFGQGEVEINDFALSNAERQIFLNNAGNKGLRLNLRQFDFSFIDDIWSYDPLNFGGRFDMEVQVNDLFQMQGINASISCDTFRINESDLGWFRLDVSTPDLKSQASAYMSITQDTMQLLAEATYNLADLGKANVVRRQLPLDQRKNHLDLSLNITGYPLNIAEWWLAGGIKDTEGSFGANLKITGMPDLPDVSGFINATNGAFTLVPLQTRYSFDQGFISADNFLFSATGTIVNDKFGNRAVVYGGITHNHLRNLGINARLRTQRFLALDLPKGANSLFYGQALGAGEVEFSGDFKRPNIYVNATALDSTRIVIPISDQADASDLDFVRFVNKHQETQTTGSNLENKILGLNLEMDLSITEEADFELVFDEQAGDIIRGNGRGDIRILLPRAGDFQMFGEVILSSGNYLFTLYEVINKDFRIKEGGRIRWTGDPYQAQIQLEAEYKDLKASLSSFIPEYLVDAPRDLKNQASQSTDVDLILNLQGDLLKPNIGFDINFPDLRGTLETYADNKLRLLRQDQNDMNRQVFGLIVVGQFLPADLSFNSTEVIANTLSEYFSNQLSLLLTQFFSEVFGEDNVLSGIDFEVAYNQYSAADLGDEQLISSGEEFEITVRQSFFNDRLSVQIGGNVGFGQEVVAANNGAFIGNDIIIEYALNRNRNLQLRLYQRREPDVGGGRRLQVGGGLSWRKEFNTFREFWESLKTDAKEPGS